MLNWTLWLYSLPIKFKRSEVASRYGDMILIDILVREYYFIDVKTGRKKGFDVNTRKCPLSSPLFLSPAQSLCPKEVKPLP